MNRFSFDHAVICTYTFDPAFFEEYCLEQFKALNNNGNITVFTDGAVYSELAESQSFERPKLANIRYLLHPISVPGVFHPKIFLFANQKRGLLIIGSANFTKPGITSNAELIGYFEFLLEKDEEHLALFQDSFSFLQELTFRWPSKAAVSNLQAIARGAPWLLATEEKNSPGIHLLHNLRQPIWEQLTAGLDSVKGMHVLSRYFDANPAILDRVRSTVDPKKLVIYTQNGITTMTIEWFEHQSVREGRTEIRLCRYWDEDYPQPLHAKAFALETKSFCRLAWGSANFTKPALLESSRSGNVETLLALDIPDEVGFRPSEMFDPSGNSIKLENAAGLKNTVPEVSWSPEAFLVRLVEANYDFPSVNCLCNIPADLQYSRGVCVITLGDLKPVFLELRSKTPEVLRGFVPKDYQKDFDEASASVRIELYDRDKSIARSNVVFLVNLRDIKSGRSLRRERYVREAEQSAGQFLAVFGELLQSDDESALLNFFLYCDIPIESGRPPIFRGMRPPLDHLEGMRSLGARNLKVFNTLHKAAIHFIERHLRKLKRHSKGSSLSTAHQYMHIAIAVCSVITAQIQRAAVGVVAKRQRIDVNEWFECRNRLDEYLWAFAELLSPNVCPFIARLEMKFGRKRVFDEIGSDIEKLQNLSRSVFGSRDQLWEDSDKKAQKIGERIILRRLSYNKYNVFGEDKWGYFKKEMNSLVEKMAKSSTNT